MIFVKILLVVIFVVVDIGLVVPETIQTKYSSTHFITHTHPPGGFLDFIQGGPKKWNSDYFWSRNLTFSHVLRNQKDEPCSFSHSNNTHSEWICCLKNAKYGCADEEIYQNSSVSTSVRFISKWHCRNHLVGQLTTRWLDWWPTLRLTGWLTRWPTC